MTQINKGFELMIPRKESTPKPKSFFYYRLRFKLMKRVFSFIIDVSGERK